MSDAVRQALLRASFLYFQESSMPVLPTGVESTPTTFTPAFTFVPQTNDFDDVFACAAMLSGKKIEEVRDIAIAKTKHPARGPYYFGESQIAALLAQLGLVATVYKEIGRVADIPDVAFLLVDYNDEMEMGRHILFHRAKGSHAPGAIEYALDPAPWCKPADRVRTSFRNIAGHWAIGIHAMNTKGNGK
ncbi:hypothetical protein [Paraburkholderia sp. BCC1885]|uniref:hypothetical protein n=1 Tax=Paraburkholderia sp. BCC1885 TaxID=2562669 RepID=UPI0021B2F920|nr:hypothetical protein [Paraburkholderia sp. BCC1885]